MVDPMHTDGSSATEPTAAGPTWGIGLLVLGILGALAYHLQFEVDDAYISFRYALSWAEGAALRY